MFEGHHYFMFNPEQVKPVCEYLDRVINGGEEDA